MAQDDTEDYMLFPTNFNLMEAIPKILNKDKESFKLTPSEFIKQMSMTMEERHGFMVGLTLKQKAVLNHYPPQFKVIPSIIVFQRFETLSTNYVTLEVRNVGKTSIGIKMRCPDSIFFSAGFANRPSTKLAPGLNVEYKIAFTPQEQRDYSHHLVFISNDCTFKVPIIAIGPRPLLDIPDQIVLDPAPVKISTNKFIVVRNIGDATAVFNFSSGSKHFQLSPAKGILPAHESLMLNITFQSNKVKEVKEIIYLMYETGEKLQIRLHGSSENVSIRLDKNSVSLEDTFITLRRCKTVHLINNSSSIVKFSWKKNESEEEDLEIIKKMREKYKEITELEILKDTKVTYFGLTSHENHKLSCERILHDELKILEKEEFLFSDEVFTLIPQSGEIWPKDSKEIIVTFGPKVCGTATAEAYLEVTGRDSRLPLKMRGTGLGPDLSMNVKMLDIDYIYLCSLHRYEIIIENKGDIPGTMEYLPEPLVFGGKIEVEPKARCLKPNELGVFVLTYTSNRPGDFTEKLNFIIKESEKDISLVLKGKIVCPTLHFDKKEINFGAVPFGISITREATLNNLSVVPVTFSLRVSPDGVEPSVSYDEFAKFTTKPSIPQFPKEFEVEPEESVVEPYSSKKVKVTVTANKVGSFRKLLIVDMWDSENGSVSCPIFYRVEVANLVGDPDMIVIPFCFINYPYTRSITVKNLSHVAGLFYIVPLQPSLDNPVTYTTSIIQGVIPPHRSVKIDVTLLISSIGRQVFPISMVTFGSDIPQEVCTISCLGQGPIINVDPTILTWGQVPLLQSSEKVVHLTNVSPIPANLEISLSKNNYFWTVSHPHLKVLPEQSAKIVVTLYLNECGKFKDALKVTTYNGKDLLIPLTAVGVGSSLLMTPLITPVFDLGTLFCHKKYEIPITVENKGTKSYGLLWSPYVEFKTFVNAKFSLPEDSMFRIDPIKMDVLPGETKIMTVAAHSKTLGYYSQTFYCFANSGSPTKKLHYTTEICAKFVGPTIAFDKEEINFWHYTGADGREEKLNDTIVIKNVSILPVQVQVTTPSPFCMVSDIGTCVNTLRVTLDGFGKKELNLKFMAPQSIRKYYKVYTSKLLAMMNDTSKTSSVILRGEVSYPNISIKPNKVDFRYVKVGTNACIEVNLMNTSPLTVYYDIKWKKQLCHVIQIDKQPSVQAFTDKSKDHVEEVEKDVCVETDKGETDSVTVGTPLSANILSTMSPPEKPTIKMPEVTVSDEDTKSLLYNLTRRYYDHNSELLNVYKTARPFCMQRDDAIASTCNKFCVITPFYGKLEPFCSQVLYVGFSSDAPVKIHLEAMVQIKAGPTEILTIDAISGDINYKLSATELDFGKQLFCETQSQALKIRNTSDMPFTFETYTGKAECEEAEQFSLGHGVVTISPSSGTLNSFQATELVVRYHPGVPGKFETFFRLRIGHLSPVVIKVRGIGVFPQVHIFLPRPEILTIAPEIGYLAVASITPDWILTEYSSGTCIYDLNQLKPYRSRENSLCDFVDTEHSGDSWEVIKCQEFVPSEIDIHLAIERILAYDLIAEDTNNTSFAVYARTIPRFVVPGYELDFEVCAVGRTVEKQVTVMNFGPLPVILYGIFGLNLKEEGIHVRLKNRNELKVGSCLPFTVAFTPKRSKYKKKYELIKSVFYFEIYHGPKIPIRISAEVTYPHVQPSKFLINFREVICGQCKIITLRLKNPGLVRARWTLVMKPETIYQGSTGEPSSLRPMFAVDCNTGVLNPSEYCTVQVSFKPACGNSFSTSILVQVAKSLETLKIQLLGTGIEPKLLISNVSLNFSAALPFPNKEEAIFTVENPSTFTIEFFFPEFDDQVLEEERILRAIALYYQTGEILLPVRRPGDGLPAEIIEFYNMLLDGLNAKFLEEEKEKLLLERDGLEETPSLPFLVEEEPAQTTQWQEVENKKKKRRGTRKASRSGSALDTTRDFGSGIVIKEPALPTIFDKKSPSEIEDLLEDFIKNNFVNESKFDPLQAAIKNSLPPVVVAEQKHGTLIICHGAPYTNSVLLASRLAISLNTMAWSIDRIVLSEAAMGRCEAGNIAREMIEQAYWEHMETEKKELTPFEVWGESSQPSEVLSYDENFEELQRKCKLISEIRESAAKAKAAMPGTARSENSKKLDKSSPTSKIAPLASNPISPILPEELVFELLRYRMALEMRNSLVIEGLDSMLIDSPTKALVMLLKAGGHVKDIITIFFLSDYVHYIQNMTIRQSEQELAKSYLREEILNVLEEEPDEAVKSLNLEEEDEAAFRSFFLAKRHEAQQQFEKKREQFYNSKDTKAVAPVETPKQMERMSSMHLNNASQLNLTSSKRRVYSRKKEIGAFSKPKLSEVNWKEESEVKIGKNKRNTIEGEFLTFQMDLIEMRAIIENWDQRLGAVVVDSMPDLKAKKGQTPRKVESLVTGRSDDSKRGVFMWLVDVSKPRTNSFLACCSNLKALLENKHKCAESDNWPVQDSDDGTTFSVVSIRTKKTLSPPQNVFILTPIYSAEVLGEFDGEVEYSSSVITTLPEKLNRSGSSLSVKTKKKNAPPSRRGKIESRTSTDTKGTRKISYFSQDYNNRSISRGRSTVTSTSGKSQVTIPYVETPMKSRWILSPGEKQMFRVRYYPTEMGTWEHKYVIKMVNWDKRETIHCYGVCDIPRINMKPEYLFPAVEHFRPLTSRFYPAFYYSLNAYDFGAIILHQSPDGKKITKRTAVLNLQNISTLPVDLSVIIDDDDTTEDQKGNECVFFEPSRLLIEPGEKKQLSVSACPTKYGSMSKVLLLVIKNNPMVDKVTLLFEGVKPAVSISPKIVNFDRQLLQRKELRNMVFTNDNTIELYASIALPENFPQEFTFSHKNLCLPPSGSFSIEVNYQSNEVQIVNEKPVLVQIFDTQNKEEPVQELTFYVNAEAYDAALDVIFTKTEEDHINFGDIRVENHYSIEFYLKNVGKYLLAYMIEIDEMFQAPDAEEFQVTPPMGRLLPGKLTPITASLFVQNEVFWKRLPFVKITLVEPFYGDEIIALIPITVSARSHYARYEIKPSNELNFGHIHVGTSKAASLLIENKGLFSLTYMIDFRASTFSEASPESSKVSGTDKNEKKKKDTNSVFKAGIFEISPGTGTVEPRQVAVLKVTAFPQEVKNHEENIVVYIDESLPHLKNGNQLAITAQACLPKVGYLDTKHIFREHHICRDESDLANKHKPGTYTVFVENSNTFSFKNVCVNTTAEARIHLENTGLIDCIVLASVKPAEEEGGRRPVVDGGSRVFSLSPEKLIVEPYSSTSIVISFKPEALEVYKAMIVITVPMPDGYEDEVWSFRVWGNGIFPLIEITEPNNKLPDGQYLVNFPPISPGHSTTSSIAFTNTGLLECKVIMELYKFQNGIFTFLPKSGTESKMKIWNPTKPIDHTAVVTLAPGEVAEFCVCFNPKEVQTYTSLLKLYIVDNPFENWCFKLTGDVFLEEVVIERIRTVMPFLVEDEVADRSAIPAAPGQYFINLTDCYVNKKSKILIRLSNKTQKDYFRFEWDEVQTITFSPNIGHLYPNSYKEILLVFLPTEPVELEDFTLGCKLSKIFLEKPPDPSWDSRLIQYQMQYKQENISARSSDKVSTTNVETTMRATTEEPAHEIIPDASKVLFIHLSGLADYTRLSCPVSKIFFKNTFMFQNRIYPIVLENPGNVPLDYKVCLKTVTVWPLKTNKMSQVDENSLLRAIIGLNRPKTANPVSQCSMPKEEMCKRRRPTTTTAIVPPVMQDQPLDDCEQEPVESFKEEDKPYFNPFAIENAVGRILPKEKTSCNIVFSPMDTNEYKAVLSIQVEHLHPECILPEIEVTASSVMPYCHFDVPESDYLESGRRDYSRPGPVGYAPGVPLHPDTRTIEVKVIGVGATVPIKFHVINPTEEDYRFSWVNTTQLQQGVAPSFHCSTMGGQIRAGRQQLMVFNFKSQKVGITESFWKFSIPEHDIETPFLLVGDARDPAIHFLSNYISLRPMLVGTSSSDVLTLVNNEDIPFEYYFIPESFYSEGRQTVLRVEPKRGTVPPNSEINLRVTYVGRTAGKAIFRVKCKVKSIKEPLTILVEAVTYLVQPVLVFEDLQKVKHTVDPNKENIIDFGSELNPNISETITVNLTNLSKITFAYEWDYDYKVLDTRSCKMTFSPPSGQITSRGSTDISIVFRKKSTLTDFPLRLKIKRGPTFHFLVQAGATVPLCDFSFSSYDFGYCFLQTRDICFNETTLIVKNRNEKPLFLECSLPEETAFSFSLSEGHVPARGEMRIVIKFHPKECIVYKSELKMMFNGNRERSILLTGEGTDFKVVLAEAEDLTISLGAVRIGKSSTRKFRLLNQSQATATLLVGFSDQFPVRGHVLLSPEKYPLDLSQGHRLTGLVTISPSTVFRIRPKESYTLTVTYTPVERSPPFSETVSFQCQEIVEPLCVLTGCCLAPHITLDRKAINFGAVVKSCRTEMKLKLVNSGSVGASFEWMVQGLTEYKISPAQGYCSPESEVTINVTFIPSIVQSCIKKMVECVLSLPDKEQHPSLWLELIGDCVALPPPKELLSFECNVRQTTKKTLEIENPGGNEWQLVPVISGEYFKTFDVLFVPPLSSVQYEVEYAPLTMSQSTFHKGSLFFKFPSGQGLLYHLKGVALPPQPEETITREVPCKTKYVELLKIKNWLQYPQRFSVKILSVEKEGDPTVTCTGLEYLEVHALVEKDYSLNFFAYNVGSYEYNVHFVNDLTNEYVWFEVIFKVHECGPLSMITLKSGIRQLCQYELKLENPLRKSIRYEMRTSSPDIRFDSVFKDVPPETSAYVIISYVPIHPGEKIENLTASCLELGVFPWDLRLVAAEPLPGPSTTFETALGSSDKREVTVQNISPFPALLVCKVDSDAFRVIEHTSAAPGESHNIEVTYEPSEIGSSTATLVVQSEQAGNFTFPLVGFCSKPLAKGPYILKPGTWVTIPFKNVFKITKEFHMYVDNPAFVLKTTQESLAAKEEFKISVGLQKIKHLENLPEYSETEIFPKFPMMGQLVVDCLNPYVKWQFYLKGVLEK